MRNVSNIIHLHDFEFDCVGCQKKGSLFLKYRHTYNLTYICIDLA